MLLQRLKIAGFLLLSTFFLFPNLNAETRHIHVLRILDNKSVNFTISEGCRAIDYGVTQEVELMKRHLGITDVQYYDISGFNFSRKRLQSVLDYELSYQERDIIILVYAGHGYREPGSNSRFPKLYFNNYAEAMEFRDLRLALIQMNPSLLINMIVACNVTQYDHTTPPPYLDDGNAPPPPEAVATLQPKASREVINYAIRQPEPYRQLFADQPGYTKVVDLMSADQDKFTFMTMDGGIFFTEILYTFQELFSAYSPRSWEQICAGITNNTVQRSRLRNMDQVPFCNFSFFISTAPEVVVNGAYDRNLCKQNAKQLRKNQKQELKSLRRQHRSQMLSLRQRNAAREERRILAARQRKQRSDMKLQHEQNYQRSLAACR